VVRLHIIVIKSFFFFFPPNTKFFLLKNFKLEKKKKHIDFSSSILYVHKYILLKRILKLLSFFLKI
jgi:hypothetical protein